MKQYGFDLDTIDVFVKKIGVDLISDMTTNIILEELCEYTKKICINYSIPLIKFSLDNGSIKPIKCELPIYRDECIILVTKSILRKDKLLLSKSNFINNTHEVVQMVENEITRDRLNNLLHKEVYVKTRKRNELKPISKRDITSAIDTLINIEPDIINKFKQYMKIIDGKTNVDECDYLIETKSIQAMVQITEILGPKLVNNIEEISFIDSVQNLLMHYKHKIERTDMVKSFAVSEMQDEKHHQRIFRIIAKAIDIGVNAKVNNGNGSVDFKCVENNESIL